MEERFKAKSKTDILEHLYSGPINLPNGIKRAIIECDFIHVSELESLGIIKRIKEADGSGAFSM